jgi:hypothetical protein
MSKINARFHYQLEQNFLIKIQFFLKLQIWSLLISYNTIW